MKGKTETRVDFSQSSSSVMSEERIQYTTRHVTRTRSPGTSVSRWLTDRYLGTKSVTQMSPTKASEERLCVLVSHVLCSSSIYLTRWSPCLNRKNRKTRSAGATRIDRSISFDCQTETTYEHHSWYKRQVVMETVTSAEAHLPWLRQLVAEASLLTDLKSKAFKVLEAERI